MHDRMLWSKGLGHNKFMVVCKGQHDPQYAWTGSMNWMTSALCTQINNGLLVTDKSVAKEYLDQWGRLRDAGSDFPHALVAANDKSKVHGDKTVWFTRTSDEGDLENCRKLINAAQEGILFLLFEPGPSGLQNEIMARANKLYVHGVINSLNQDKGRQSPGVATHNVNVNLIRSSEQHQFNLDVVQPEGIKRTDLHQWAQEVTRQMFLMSQHGWWGYAIIHSKVIVLDPFGEKPIVISGSHNMGASASKKNDENLIIIQGNRELAEKYAVHISAVYDHFRWRAQLLQENKPYEGLQRDDKWQEISSARRKDVQFWIEGGGAKKAPSRPERHKETAA